MASSAVTPPPGFVLEDQNSTPPPGFVIEGSPEHQSFLSKAGEVGVDVGKGVLEGAGQTINSVSKLLNKVPGVGEALAPSAGTQGAQQLETPGTTGEKVGVGIEGVLEFISGDAALSGLSAAAKLGKLAKVAQLLEEHPALMRVAAQGVRNAATGTVQGLAHGESGERALESGAMAGITGAGLETAAEGVRAIAPATKTIAGAEIPVRASQDSAVAKQLENVADSGKLKEFEQKTQAGAREAMGNIATEVRDKAVDPLIKQPEGTPPRTLPAIKGEDVNRSLAEQTARRDLGSAASTVPESAPSDAGRLVKEVGSQAATIPSSVLGDVNFPAGEALPKVELPRAESFGEAADSLRKTAQTEVFQKLDQLSDNALSKAQNQEKLAWRARDLNAVQEARDAQDAVFNKFQSEFSPDQLTQARGAWRQASAFDAIQAAVDNATHATPAELAKMGQPEVGYIHGNELRENLLTLSQKTNDLDVAFKDTNHAQNMQDLGLVLEKGDKSSERLNAGMKALIAGGQVAGAVLKGDKGLVRKAAGAVGAEWAAGKMLGKIMTDPEAGKTLLRWLDSSASPKALVKAIPTGIASLPATVARGVNP